MIENGHTGFGRGAPEKDRKAPRQRPTSALSFRDVEELMAERGVQVSYESIRRWCAKFGPAFALQLRRGRARPGDNGISTK